MEAIKKFIVTPFKRVFRTGDSSKCVVLTPEERLTLTLNPYQSYLSALQRLLLWKEPKETLIFIAVINILFILWVRMEWRFYGVIFSSLLAFVLYEAWTDWIWPEIRVPKPIESPSPKPVEDEEGVLTVSELSRCVTTFLHIVSDLVTRMKVLRLRHPSLFCSICVGVCAVVAKVGSAVPGLGLLYLVVMCLVLGPGLVIHCIPPETKASIACALGKLLSFLQPPDTAIGVDEYLPEPSKDNLALFSLASGDFDSTSGSTPNSEVEVMPEEPIPGFDESSMEPDDSLALDPSSSSALSFKPTHFNGVSALGAALGQALAETLGPSLLVPSAVQPAPRSDDSDSSDFELLDPEDSNS